MTNTPKILAFAGSMRRDSLNRKLIEIAAFGARDAGADVTVINLKDYPLPVYDSDSETEHGLPDNAIKLKDLFNEHHGLLIAAPEYNSSITGVLKNLIDWVSRPLPGDSPLKEFDGKVAGLVSASPGALGGLRGLVHVRSILSNIRVIVVPNQRAVTKAHEAFAADGSMKDEKTEASVKAVGADVASLLKKLLA